MKKYLALGLLVLSASAFADSDASLWVFKGRGNLNGGSVPKHTTGVYQIEQETKNYDIGYLNEGSMDNFKRDGLFVMRRVSFDLTPKLESSVAFGPYGMATTVDGPSPYSYHYHYGVSLMTAISIKYRVVSKLSVQARYEHIMLSTDSRDTDALIAGLGYNF